MQIHLTDWNFHFLAPDLASKANCVQKVIKLENSTSSVRFRRLGFSPIKEKRQWRLTIAVRFLERATGIEPASQAWEAWVITIIRRPRFSEKSIPHVTLGLIKILPVFNNPFEKAFSLLFLLPIQKTEYLRMHLKNFQSSLIYAVLIHRFLR